MRKKIHPAYTIIYVTTHTGIIYNCPIHDRNYQRVNSGNCIKKPISFMNYVLSRWVIQFYVMVAWRKKKFLLKKLFIHRV